MPNFGDKDQDILDFEVALAAAEKMHKHKFVLPHVTKPKWGDEAVLPIHRQGA